jgi:U5 small nuclear ribonucleoprotein component
LLLLLLLLLLLPSVSPLNLVLQIDRLITELKLPPADAYHKIAFTIEEVNSVIRTAGGGDAANGTAAAAAGTTPLLDPVVGNVAFASCAYGYSFTLRSFAQLYKGVCGDAPKDVLLVDEFARRLWGDVWYYPEERVFRRKPPQLGECVGMHQQVTESEADVL